MASLEPRLSVLDFVLQFWRKIRIFLQSCETKSRTESVGLRLLYGHDADQQGLCGGLVWIM